MADKDRYVNLANQDSTHREFLKDSAVNTAGVSEFISRPSTYPALASGSHPDLYRAFMAKTWQLNTDKGIISLIHPESHFKEKKAGTLRSNSYHRLRQHWQFINKLILFEISDHVVYGVHIYGNYRKCPEFKMASSLYHPDMVAQSLKHDGSGEEPRLKLNGYWDLRPHRSRIIDVDETTLKTWAELLDPEGTPPDRASMIYTVNKTSERVLKKLAAAPRVRELGLQYSTGWNETTDRQKGFFEARSHRNDSWSDVIIQGPFFSVANPFAKEPNPTMRSNEDYTPIDLEALPEDFIPRTSYQPVGSTADNSDYDKSYTHWVSPETGERVSARRFYRLAWRRMAALTGVRTLYPTIIPPGASHVDPVGSAGSVDDSSLAGISILTGNFSSLVIDFLVRSSGVSDLRASYISNLPYVTHNKIQSEIIKRNANLVCLTDDYKYLYEVSTGDKWHRDKICRVALERLKVQAEIDALVALGFNLSEEELITIYRTQFSVLQKNDKTDLFDKNGRKVPKELAKLYTLSLDEGSSLTTHARTWTHPQSKVEYTFEEPFSLFDREAELRQAYKRFSTLYPSTIEG